MAYDFSDFEDDVPRKPEQEAPVAPVATQSVGAPKYDFSDLDTPVSTESHASPLEQTAPTDNFSLPEALALSVGNAVSAQTLPKIAAALSAITDKGSYSEQYPKRLAEARQLIEQAQTEHPIGSVVGEIGGAVLSPLGLIGRVGKGAKLAESLAGAAKAGAAFGGVAGYGASDKEGLEAAGDVAEGAAIGGLTAPAVLGTLSVGGKALKGTGRYIAENPFSQKMAAAFKFGKENPEFYTTESRQNITKNLRDTIREEVLPLVDDTLEEAGQSKYTAAKTASGGEWNFLQTPEFTKKVIPEFNQQVFESSDAARYVGRDLLKTLTGLDADGLVDVNKAYALKNKISDLMTKVSPQRNPVDRDAYHYLNGIKQRLDDVLQSDYRIPTKQLSSQYSKAGDFKAAMGADLDDKVFIQDKKKATETTLDQLSNLFLKASKDKGSDEAVKIEEAYSALKKSGLVDPETIDQSLAAVQKAAKEADLIKTMYSGGMHTGAMGEAKSLGLGAKAMLTTAAATAGKLSAPIQNVMYNTVQRLSSATPEVLVETASKVNNTEVANILRKLATEPQMKRKALIYSMMQQPAYQEAFKQIMGEEEVQEADSGGH